MEYKVTIKNETRIGLAISMDVSAWEFIERNGMVELDPTEIEIIAESRFPASMKGREILQVGESFDLCLGGKEGEYR